MGRARPLTKEDALLMVEAAAESVRPHPPEPPPEQADACEEETWFDEAAGEAENSDFEFVDPWAANGLHQA